MQPKRPYDHFRAVAVTFTVVLFLTSAWAADHETVLYSFGFSGDGGGGANLIRDAAGNLYGAGGGGIYLCGRDPCGTLYELSPVAGGGWTKTVLHNFGNGTDGSAPDTPIMDAAGNLYGLTESGGLYGGGIAYELSPSQGGAWTETVLWSFGNGSDGEAPESGVIMDAAGNLYGTTVQGGTYCPSIGGCGIVYELSPSEGGYWTETVLHNFDNDDGLRPWASLILDAAGNLYGTTSQGGAYSDGTVFELSPNDGGWTETVLHSFRDDGHDGLSPLTPVILDTAGNLYGTTMSGGMNRLGTVFELSARQGGWTETVLHDFNGNDGEVDFGGVVMDKGGDLYGNTQAGGRYGYGTAYELTPPAARPRVSAVH
jgi:uncharacterized repeat protein (TIGR03803 family)